MEVHCSICGKEIENLDLDGTIPFFVWHDECTILNTKEW